MIKLWYSLYLFESWMTTNIVSETQMSLNHFQSIGSCVDFVLDFDNFSEATLTNFTFFFKYLPSADF